MSISTVLFTASTALEAFGTSIAVSGDNIANLNTVGFKTSRTQFADLLPTLSAQVEKGHGVRLTDVRRSFQQGMVETTQRVTDLAIEGQGFFVVRDASGELFYTRAGEFHFDASGKLVNPLDLTLQGSSGDLSLDPELPAQATSGLELAVRLDPSASIPGVAFPVGPDAPSSAWHSAANFSSVVRIYDAAGGAHDLTFLFRKVAPNQWQYRVLAPRNELDAGAPGSTELREVSPGGTLVFNSDGSLDLSGSAVSDIDGLNWVGGASQLIPAANLTFADSVQYAGPSSLISSDVDGHAAGSLTGVLIDPQGVVTGRYSNGVSRAFDTIVLANFTSTEDLAAVGNGLFRPTVDSGPARVGTPAQNELGRVIAGALEMSTVDLAREFVSLITSERSFQVNSRVLSVADQMYAEAANLKR